MCHCLLVDFPDDPFNCGNAEACGYVLSFICKAPGFTKTVWADAVLKVEARAGVPDEPPAADAEGDVSMQPSPSPHSAPAQGIF